MIKHLLEKLLSENISYYAIPGKVISVDEENRSCVVSPLNGDADFYNVKIQASLGGDKGISVTPKVGSIVIINAISDTVAFIAKTYEIDKVEVSIDDLLFELNSDGISLLNNNESFASTVKDLVQETKALAETVKSLILLTSSGPTTGISPASLASLQAHELKFDQIENAFEKMLVE